MQIHHRHIGVATRYMSYAALILFGALGMFLIMQVFKVAHTSYPDDAKSVDVDYRLQQLEMRASSSQSEETR